MNKKFGLKKYGAVAASGNNQLVKRAKEREKAAKEAEWQAGVERVYQGVDRPLLIVVILLVCMGAITLLSASYPYAIAKNQSSMYYFYRTLIYILVGIFIIGFLCFVPRVVNFLKKATPAIYIITVLLLVAVLFIGKNLNGARRSFSLGFVSVQPSEIAKLAIILTLALYIEKVGENLHKGDKKNQFFVGILYPAVLFAVIVGLIALEKHLSCIIILSVIFFFMELLSGVNAKHLILFCLIVGGTFVIIYLLMNPYAVARIVTHASDDADQLDEAWQTTQSLLAIGNGGALGVGLGQSTLKFSYISEPMNDFIFAVFCEELGFVGAMILVALFGVFVWRGMKIALHAKDTFSQLTAFGITLHIGIQAVFNIFVVTDIFPNTGISLPFFSFGGSALMMQMAEAGILLAISKHSYVKIKKEDRQ